MSCKALRSVVARWLLQFGAAGQAHADHTLIALAWYMWLVPGQGRSPNPTISLQVYGPDGARYQVEARPGITAGSFAKAFLRDQYGSDARLVAVDHIIEHESDPPTVMRLDKGVSLARNRVKDGHTVRVSPLVYAAGTFELVVAFLAGAIGSGIAGNAAYDLVKGALARIARRKRRPLKRGAALSKRDVADIAIGCCRLKFSIPDDETIEILEYAGAKDGGLAILETSNGIVEVFIEGAEDRNPENIVVEVRLTPRPRPKPRLPKS